MAVPKPLSTISMASISVLAFGVVALAAVANSETVVRNGFSAALKAPSPPLSEAQSLAYSLAKAKLASTKFAKSQKRDTLVAGSEDYWLSAGRTDGDAGLTKAVAVGDQIVLSVGGKDIRLEVADVSEYAPQVTAIDARDGSTRYLMVTARDMASANAEPVRFVMEVRKPIAGSAAQGEHAS